MIALPLSVRFTVFVSVVGWVAVNTAVAGNPLLAEEVLDDGYNYVLGSTGMYQQQVFIGPLNEFDGMIFLDSVEFDVKLRDDAPLDFYLWGPDDLRIDVQPSGWINDLTGARLFSNIGSGLPTNVDLKVMVDLRDQQIAVEPGDELVFGFAGLNNNLNGTQSPGSSSGQLLIGVPNNPVDPGFAQPGDLAFRLFVVPEPSTAGLASIGISAIVASWLLRLSR